MNIGDCKNQYAEQHRDFQDIVDKKLDAAANAPIYIQAQCRQPNADIVMFIYRDDYYDAESDDKNVAEIILAKNRHGATGTVELQWIGQYTTFSSRDRIHS